MPNLIARPLARAWWMSALILTAIAAGVYFGWPHLAIFMGKTTMAGVLKKNARDCGQGRKQECLDNIRKMAKAEADVDLPTADIKLLIAKPTKVVFAITYRAKLKYPITGTLFGNGKWTYKRVRMKEDIKLSGY